MVTITAKAAEQAKRRVEASGEHAQGLRIGVKGGGCSGYYYVYDLAKEIRPDKDEVIDVDGFKVVIDKRSLRFVAGGTLDWESKLMSHGFVWHNPNAVGDCGCGSSFHVADDFFSDADFFSGAGT